MVELIVLIRLFVGTDGYPISVKKYMLLNIANCV